MDRVVRASPFVAFTVGPARNAGGLAGVAVLVGLVVFVTLDRRENFDGRERVERILGCNPQYERRRAEPVEMQASQLGDWFYMRGFEAVFIASGVRAPAGRRLAGVSSQWTRVAQVAIDERNSLFYVFRASDFGVDLPDGGDWRLLNDEGWAAAIRRQGDTCTMITFRGSRSEMREFLRKLKLAMSRIAVILRMIAARRPVSGRM